MQKIRYQFSIPRYLAAALAYRWSPALLASGRLAGLELVDEQPAELPGPEWLRVRPRLCGICGSDMALITGKNSPALSPFTSFPAVPGHEIVAEVVEAGTGVTNAALGDRVVVDPFISCQMRGLEQCPACARGEACLCIRSAEGKLSPGMLIGFCRDLDGGWSEEMVVHTSQIYQVPLSIKDTEAVLVEPLSVCLHAILKQPPRSGSTILVLGGGTIGLCMVAALELLELECQVTALVRYPFQAKLASKLGAETVFGKERSAGQAAVQVANAKEYRTLLGTRVYTGGFDVVYDCIGSRHSLTQSLQVAGPKGQIILVGCAGEIDKLDWSFIWARELQISGSYGYSREPSLPGGLHTFQVALQLLAGRPNYPLAELVTHTYPLSGWREAISTNLHRKRSNGIKTVFTLKSSENVP